MNTNIKTFDDAREFAHRQPPPTWSHWVAALRLRNNPEYDREVTDYLLDHCVRQGWVVHTRKFGVPVPNGPWATGWISRPWIWVAPPRRRLVCPPTYGGGAK